MSNGSTNSTGTPPPLSDNQTQVIAYLGFDATFNKVVVAMRPIHGSMGIVGSILLFCTLIRNKEFNGPCFVCYKGLAIASFIYGVFEIIMPAYRISFVFNLPSSKIVTRDFTYSWITYVLGFNTYNATEQISIYLIIFLSVHRAAACLLPTKFKLINTKLICRAVTIASFVITISYMLPAYILEGVTQQGGVFTSGPSSIYDYWQPKSSSYQTYFSIRSSLYMVQVPAVLVSSALAIAGLLKVIWLRRKLKRVAPAPPSDSSRRSKATDAGVAASKASKGNRIDDENYSEWKWIKDNLQLCLLQLSQAIPFAAFCGVHFVAVLCKWTGSPSGTKKDSFGRPNDASYWYIGTLVHQLDLALESLSNDYHFWLLLIFSDRFRKQFKRRAAKVLRSVGCGCSS